MSNTHTGNLGRTVQVDMNFGRTYIKVEAFDIASGNRVNTKVNLLPGDDLGGGAHVAARSTR